MVITSLLLISNQTHPPRETPQYTSLGYRMASILETQQDTSMRRLGCLSGSKRHSTIKSRNQRRLRFRPDILISLYGRAPNSSCTFAKVDNINAERGTSKCMFNSSHSIVLYRLPSFNTMLLSK